MTKFAEMMKDLKVVTNTRSGEMDRQFFVDHEDGLVDLLAVIAAWPVMRANVEALMEIVEIDKAFEEATGYGSWMISRANYRERLVNMLRGRGIMVEHKHQARSGTGGKVN